MSFDKEKFREECDRRRNDDLGIGGKTYEIKDQIKELGGIWDSMKKQWLMPDSNALATVKDLMGGKKPDVSTEPTESGTEATQVISDPLTRKREPGDDDEPLVIDNTPF